MKTYNTVLTCFYKYTLCFLFLVCLILFLCCNIEKQEIINPGDINSLELFINILPRNTLSFLFIVSSLFVGKINVYLFIGINAASLGILLSKFKYTSYIITILPHGILEIGVYLFLCSVVSVGRFNPRKETYRMIAFLYLGLVIAACIETWITPMLADRYLLNT